MFIKDNGLVMRMSRDKLKYILFLTIVIVFLFICSAGMILLIKDSNERKKPPVEEGDISFIADTNTINFDVLLCNKYYKNITKILSLCYKTNSYY